MHLTLPLIWVFIHEKMYLLRQPSARREHYVLAYRPASTGQRWRHGGSRTLRGRAILALQPSASAGDIAQALLQVAHLRCLPYRGDLSAHDARRWALEESYRRARRDRRAFLRALQVRCVRARALLPESEVLCALDNATHSRALMHGNRISTGMQSTFCCHLRSERRSSREERNHISSVYLGQTRAPAELDDCECLLAPSLMSCDAFMSEKL